jgi:hypothetical protein
MKTISLCVPSGIGDISWIYSKLHCAPPEFDFELFVADGWPHRSVEFCRMLPRVVRSDYEDFNYKDILSFQRVNNITTFEGVATNGFGRTFISCNEHLEQGKRLEDWLPDLKTDFHYPVVTMGDDMKTAFELINPKGGVDVGVRLIGVSAASYRGSEAWDTWRSPKWNRFMDLLQEVADKRLRFVLLGGFWDDLTFALSKRWDAIELVGKTTIGQAYELHKLLDGYIGFSSGLGVLSTLLSRPTVMLWPRHQAELSTSWAPPEMLKEHSYIASQWVEPFEVVNQIEGWLKNRVLGGLS